jgi:hypothetical protein
LRFDKRFFADETNEGEKKARTYFAIVEVNDAVVGDDPNSRKLVPFERAFLAHFPKQILQLGTQQVDQARPYIVVADVYHENESRCFRKRIILGKHEQERLTKKRI